jgi:hypothetical protein
MYVYPGCGYRRKGKRANVHQRFIHFGHHKPINGEEENDKERKPQPRSQLNCLM